MFGGGEAEANSRRLLDVLVTGVPPACMTLVTVLTGVYDEGDPIPEGSDSVMFQNLSNDDVTAIQNALSAHAK